MTSSLRTRWDAGEPCLGSWLSLPSSVVAEAVGAMGFDYVCLDLQHGALDYGHVVHGIQGVELGGGLPVVRVPWNEPGIIGKVLDAGARGVIVPYVESAEQAGAAVSAARYPPDGSRSYGPMMAALRRAETEAEANAAVAVVVMVETVAGLSALEDIVSVPGVDAVYVGPADLSLSLGLRPGNHDDDERFSAALDHVVATCVAAGVVPGIHSTAGLAPRRLGQGFRMVTVSADFGALRTGMSADLAEVRTHLSEASATSADGRSDGPAPGY